MTPDPMMALRRLVRRELLLYRGVCLYRSAILRQYVALARRDTDLCIEGYPSSGNSFAMLTVRDVFPGLRLASHRHCIAAVKRAFALDVPVLIVIRDPRDAISSYVVRFGVTVERAVIEYGDFYGWLAREPRPLLVDFDSMMMNPQLFVGQVAQLLRRPVPADVARRDLAQCYREQMEQRMLELSNEPSNWVVPNEQKERRKDAVRDQLANAWQPEMLRLTEIYSMLRQRAAIPSSDTHCSVAAG